MMGSGCREQSVSLTKTHRLVVLSSLFQRSSLPFSLEANCQLPPVWRGNRVFCASQAREWGANIFCRDSFNPVLRMLLVAAPWVSLGHCSWKREAAGASCSSQPGFGWIIKKFTRQVKTKVLAHSWLLSPFPHWLDHTSYIITSWSGLRCQWRQVTMC